VTRTIGRGWATVEVERAAAALADLLAPGAAFQEAPRSAILGARCLRGRAGPAGAGDEDDDGDDPDWIVLLEPDTEGRLAGYLARFGEGWAATWTVRDDPRGRRGAGLARGPLGEERLADRSPPVGPFRLQLSAATIDP
jgi:hypothetical protein